MEVVVRRIGEPFLAEAENEQGNTIRIDGSSSAGGTDKGFRPMELLLAGIAGCSSIDLVLILKKQRQELQGYEIKVTGDREKQGEVTPFTAIHLHYTLYGDIQEQKAQRALELSVEKYCSVSTMLEKSAKVTWSFENKGSSMKQNRDIHFETAAVRTQTPRTPEGEHSTPLFMTSSFVFDNAEDARARFAGEKEGNIYSRYSNPTTDEFVDKMVLLENGEDGVATASGMSAMFLSLVSFLETGDHIVSSRSIFGSTHQVITRILPRWGISHTYVDVSKPENWEQAITPKTKIIYAETPTNPALDIVDLEYLGRLAADRGLLFVVDNCFATPYLQKPLNLGAHISAHSATKFIDGQGRCIGGVVTGSKVAMEEVRFLARQTGPALSPFNAWILSKSLETLAVRMDRHCENALALAEYLETRNDIDWVKYPFLKSHPGYETAVKQMKLGGGLVSFQVKGGIERGRTFLDTLSMASLSANLGDTRTIITHPASTTHSKLSEEERLAVGITGGFVRISVGLEHIDDIIADVTQALDRTM